MEVCSQSRQLGNSRTPPLASAKKSITRMKLDSEIKDLFEQAGDEPQKIRRTAKSTGALNGLNAVDWNFAHRKRHSAMEALHPYPAKFIAEIPRALLEHLPIDK